MKHRGFLFAFILVVNLASSQSNNKDFRTYEQTIPGSAVTFKMVPVPEGVFIMGSDEKEKFRESDEGPQRNVKVSPFWMGAYEVTYDEFLLFFNDEQITRNSTVDAVTRPTLQYIDLSWGMGKQGGFPANSMSQRTALMYCRWLFTKTGQFYRLPTEAEWEYACRAGNSTPYFFGTDPKMADQYAWYSSNSSRKYQKVGQKKPNSWGLYDMHGNVSEWTLDQYDEKYFTKIQDGAQDPCIPPSTTYPKAVRGGGYLDESDQLRCASRAKSDPSWNKRDPQIPKSKWWLTDAMSVGFRLVRPLKQPTPEEANEFYQKYLGN